MDYFKCGCTQEKLLEVVTAWLEPEDDKKADLTLREVSEHGADTGWNDTCKFMKTHGQLVWELFYQFCDDLGQKPLEYIDNSADIYSQGELDNWLAWWALESAAHFHVDRADESDDDETGTLPDALEAGEV